MAQSYNKNTLRNPDGTEAVIDNVSGIAFKSGALLAANGSVNTGWISYGQYMSASIVVFSDTAGNLKYEYSADGGTTILESINTTFVTLNDFRVAVIPLGKGTHFKLTYTNGTTAQTKFYLSVSLGLDLVESMGSVYTPININNIASITKTFLQVPDSNLQTALYDFVTRTGNSLNVNNTNNITGFGLETTQLLVKAKTDNLDVALSTRLKPSDTLTGVTTLGTITNALPVGNNIIGQVSINQTTQGVTNFVTNNNSQINGNTISTNSGLPNTGTQRVVLANRVESFLGAVAVNDLAIPTGQRIKSLLFTNNTPSVIYLQIFNKASALVLADVPLNGLIIRIPANSTLDKNTGDFGEAGILYGANTRIGLSSTFDTFTAITPINRSNTSINVITVA